MLKSAQFDHVLKEAIWGLPGITNLVLTTQHNPNSHSYELIFSFVREKDNLPITGRYIISKKPLYEITNNKELFKDLIRSIVKKVALFTTCSCRRWECPDTHVSCVLTCPDHTYD